MAGAQKKLTELSPGRLEESVSSPSSVRRSARIKDSPAISYKDSLRNSSARDSRYKKRIFGLNTTESEAGQGRQQENISPEEDRTAINTDTDTANNYKQRISSITKVVLQSPLSLQL